MSLDVRRLGTGGWPVRFETRPLIAFAEQREENNERGEGQARTILGCGDKTLEAENVDIGNELLRELCHANTLYVIHEV